jgi:hypothetical protein
MNSECATLLLAPKRAPALPELQLDGCCERRSFHSRQMRPPLEEQGEVRLMKWGSPIEDPLCHCPVREKNDEVLRLIRCHRQGGRVDVKTHRDCIAHLLGGDTRTRAADGDQQGTPQRSFSSINGLQTGDHVDRDGCHLLSLPRRPLLHLREIICISRR